MRHRYYDPIQARFLTRDPIYLTLQTRNNLHANPYQYTAGQPTHRTDASGLDSFEGPLDGLYDSSDISDFLFLVREFSVPDIGPSSLTVEVRRTLDDISNLPENPVSERTAAYIKFYIATVDAVVDTRGVGTGGILFDGLFDYTGVNYRRPDYLKPTPTTVAEMYD